MAWTTPRTYTTGEVLTAAIFNAHVRDNENFLYGAHGAKVYQGAAQTLTTAVNTTLNFDTEESDTDAYHDTATNNSRLTVPSGLDGHYLIVAETAYVANATGQRRAQINRNGSRIALNVNDAAASGQSSVIATTVRLLAATDYVESAGQQNSGGNLDTVSGQVETKLMALWMGN